MGKSIFLCKRNSKEFMRTSKVNTFYRTTSSCTRFLHFIRLFFSKTIRTTNRCDVFEESFNCTMLTPGRNVVLHSMILVFSVPCEHWTCAAPKYPRQGIKTFNDNNNCKQYDRRGMRMRLLSRHTLNNCA